MIPVSAIQTLAIETNHEGLKDLKEDFAGCMEGKSACPFEVFTVFVVRFSFLSLPALLPLLSESQDSGIRCA